MIGNNFKNELFSGPRYNITSIDKLLFITFLYNIMSTLLIILLFLQCITRRCCLFKFWPFMLGLFVSFKSATRKINIKIYALKTWIMVYTLCNVTLKTLNVGFEFSWYSKISMTRTMMAREPWLIRSRPYESLVNSSDSSRKQIFSDV